MQSHAMHGTGPSKACEDWSGDQLDNIGQAAVNSVSAQSAEIFAAILGSHTSAYT